MGQPLCDLHPLLQIYRTEVFGNEFNTYTSAGAEGFTTVSGSTGTSAVYNTGGVSKVLLTTAATDNDTQTVRSTNKIYALQDNHPIQVNGRANFANQAGSNANVVFGLGSTTSLTITDGQAPAASYTGAVIFKGDGSTVWSVQSSNASVKTTTVTDQSAVDGTYTFAIAINHYNAAQCELVFYINGSLCRDSVTHLPIKHYVSYTSAADMYVFAQTAAGSANAQLCYVDYLFGVQLRSGL